MRKPRNDAQKLVGLILVPGDLMSNRFRSVPFRQRLTTAKRFLIRFCFAIIAALVLTVFFSMSQSVAAQSTFTTQRANGRIAFVSERDGNSEIYVMNPDGSDQTNITHDSAYDGDPAWSPDGRKIAFSSYRDGHSEIYVMNADGSEVTRLTYDLVGNSAPFGGLGNFAPDWSPDGTKIAFTSFRGDLNASGRANYDIYVMNADGSNEVRLTNDPSADLDPDWSPDGTHIAFASDRDRDIYEIYVMKADGSGQTNITKNGLPNNFSPDNSSPDWSPVGTKIVFVSRFDIGFGFCEPGYPCGIFVMNADGSNQVALDEFHGYSPVWSPDGTRIAYHAIGYEDHHGAVHVMNADGSNRTRLTEGGGSPAWQPLVATSPNPLGDPQFFVRQHYLDFLGREPDPGGLAFWTNEILSCGSDARCVEAKRINVSAAYFLSIEFQETGYEVYRFYKAGYGDLAGTPVPIRFSEFIADTQAIGNGVIVNQPGWEQVLERNKQQFAADFVQRSRFTSAFPSSMTPEAFVDALFTNAGVSPASSERAAAINEFGSVSTTADVAARARALRRVAENTMLAQLEFNRAFVLMQYFGYLRRNPNDAPEPTLDFQGYNFWLNKLNGFNGDFAQAEMVKAFITSAEYRKRFGP